MRSLVLLFPMLCICELQPHPVLCNGGTGNFETEFRTGEVHIGAARQGALATRSCTANLIWENQAHKPGQKPGKAHARASRERQPQLCARRLVSDDAKRAKGIEMEFLQRRALEFGFYIPRKQFRFPERELCGGRA